MNKNFDPFSAVVSGIFSEYQVESNKIIARLRNELRLTNCKEVGVLGDVIEVLAEQSHEAWCGWMEYMFSLCEETVDGRFIIPDKKVDRWMRQMTTKYSDLTEEEKISDRVEARNWFEVFRSLPFTSGIDGT